MPEKCKLKYLKICKDENLVYEIIDKFNTLLNQNILSSKEEKLKQLNQIKNKDIKLYRSMKENINAEIY